MEHILFVCTGNTCRSCMAEGILKNLIINDNVLNGNLSVTSTGICARDGEPASQYSREVLKDKWGIDIDAHRAKRLTEADTIKADLILTMTMEHKLTVTALFPSASKKTFALKEYVIDTCGEKEGRSLDISDPYGGSTYVYEMSANEIKKSIECLVKKIKNRVISNE